MLSRKLSAMGHYPAIDVLNSISRLASKIASDSDKAMAQQVREALALYHNSEDLIQLGAYVAGSNTRLDGAIRSIPSINQFLRQEPDRKVTLNETAANLENVARTLRTAPVSDSHREPPRKA